MNIHVFQHVSFEGPGIIAEWCLNNGHYLEITPFYSPGHRLPDMDGVDMLIIMGGPMSVYDDDIYPWLREEKAFISSFLRLGRPILGICLGAQLLAVCSGAAVRSAPQKEIGWFPVTPSAAARDIAWFYSLFENAPVLFHWHGDRFDIPRGAANLAATEANDNQAFLLNDNVLGLQFHAEVMEEGLQRMVEDGSQELQEKGAFIQPAEVVLNTTSFDVAHPIMYTVLNHLISTTCH